MLHLVLSQGIYRSSGNLSPMPGQGGRFWMSVALGVIVMILIAIFTVNALDLVPLVGPFVGGLVAGWALRKDFLRGGIAGVAAGLIGAVIVAFDFMMQTGYTRAALSHFRPIADLFFLGVALIYFPVLGFIGGAIGGLLRR